jgi:hypothetical protein
MIKFQNETQNFAKSTHFEKLIFILQWFTQNMWSIGETICIFNKKFQKTSFKNSFIWKSEKGLKRIHILFVKYFCWLLCVYLQPSGIWQWNNKINTTFQGYWIRSFTMWLSCPLENGQWTNLCMCERFMLKEMVSTFHH